MQPYFPFHMNHTSFILDIISVPACVWIHLLLCRIPPVAWTFLNTSHFVIAGSPDLRTGNTGENKLSEHYSYYHMMHDLHENSKVRILIGVTDSKMKTSYDIYGALSAQQK